MNKSKCSRSRSRLSVLAVALAFAVGISTSGCSSGGLTQTLSKQVSGTQTRFDKALARGQCADAAENIPEKDGSIRFLGRVDRATGTVISYAATGAGYTADFAITIVGGAILYSVLSFPVALPSNPPDGPYQGEVNHINVPVTKIGSAIYNSTTGMRCPDLTAMSSSIRRVAECFAKDPEKPTQLSLAKKTLDSVATNKDVMNCIAPDEKSALQSAEFKLDQQLARFPASALEAESPAMSTGKAKKSID